MSLMVFAFLFNWIFIFSVLVSAAVGLGVYFSIPRIKDDDEIFIAAGITQKQLNEQLARIQTDMETFSDYLALAQNERIKPAITAIIDSLGLISDNFGKNPKDMQDAGMTLNMYLDRTRDILARYMHLNELNVDPAYPASIEQTILRIPELFQDYYQKCIQDDLIEMEVSHELFKDILDMEILKSDDDTLPRKE